MQGDQRPSHAARLDAGQQLGGEVQTGGRRRHRAVAGREHRLIVAFVVLGLAAAPLDVGRQRHPAVRRQRRHQRRPGTVEGQRHLAGFALGRHLGREILREHDAVALAQLLGWARERPPSRLALALVQRHLDPRFAAPAVDPGRYHPGVVGDQQVARPQQVGQVGHGSVDQGCAGQVEQPGGVARARREAGDAVFRQVIVEQVDAHQVRVVSAWRHSAGRNARIIRNGASSAAAIASFAA